MRVTLISKQIGHYHDARYRAAIVEIPDFNVISVTNEGFFKEFLAADSSAYPVLRLYPDRAAYEAACSRRAVWSELGAALDGLDPEMVAISGWASPESFAAIVWAKRKGRRIVVLSESQEFDAARDGLRELIKSRIVRLCDAALVGGRPHRDYVAKLGLPPERIALGYNAVGNAHFVAGSDVARAEAEALRAEHGLPRRYVLASGRFIPKKNFPRLVGAYAAASRLRPDAPDLVILGDGEERPAIEEAVARHGLAGRVHLPGYRGYDVLPVFYGLAEAFAHVSTVEQWGLVINEAAASALPLIVSHRCGAASELVEDDVNGWLVDPADDAQMAAALGQLFDLPTGARAKMGAKSRRIVGDWGPERFAAGLRQACSAARTAPGRGLAPWDRLAMRVLGRQSIRTVH